MNGYELTHNMRRARRRHCLNSTDQALFYELVAICNEEGWPSYFKCSNAELCTAIRITENTLVKSRSQLIDAGLISFKSGKSKREYSTYKLTTSKNEVKTEVVNEVKDEGKTSAKDADYNKQKTQTETQTEIYNKSLSEIDISEVPENDMEYFKIAKKFQELFIKNLNENNAPSETQKKAKFKSWVNPIRLMIEKDKVSSEQFKTAYNFLKSREGSFWKTNILSTKKLREKLPSLIMQANNSQNNKSNYNVKNDQQEGPRVGRTPKETINNLSNSEGFSVNR